jgi:hypothetical protein
MGAMRSKLRTLILLTGLATILMGCNDRGPAADPDAVSNADPMRENAGSAPDESAAPIGHATPNEAFNEYVRALKAEEWGAVFDVMTPRRQDLTVMQMHFAAWVAESDVVEGHIDEKAVAEAMGEEPSEEHAMAVILKHMKDKRAFFVDAATEMGPEIAAIPKGPLRSVRVSGKHAQGVARQTLEHIAGDGTGQMKRVEDESEETIYFFKSESGWLLDASPTDIIPTRGNQNKPPDSVNRER